MGFLGLLKKDSTNNFKKELEQGMDDLQLDTPPPPPDGKDIKDLDDIPRPSIDVPPPPPPDKMQVDDDDIPEAPPDDQSMDAAEDIPRVPKFQYDMPELQGLAEPAPEKDLPEMDSAPPTEEAPPDMPLPEDIPPPKPDDLDALDLPPIPQIEKEKPKPAPKPHPKPAPKPAPPHKVEPPKVKAPPKPAIKPPERPEEDFPPIAEKPHIKPPKAPEVDMSYLEGKIDFTKPIFVRLELYSQVFEASRTIKRNLAEAEQNIAVLNDTELSKEKHFERFQRSLEEIQRKLVAVDKRIFKNE